MIYLILILGASSARAGSKLSSDPDVYASGLRSVVSQTWNSDDPGRQFERSTAKIVEIVQNMVVVDSPELRANSELLARWHRLIDFLIQKVGDNPVESAKIFSFKDVFEVQAAVRAFNTPGELPRPLVNWTRFAEIERDLPQTVVVLRAKPAEGLKVPPICRKLRLLFELDNGSRSEAESLLLKEELQTAFTILRIMNEEDSCTSRFEGAAST